MTAPVLPECIHTCMRDTLAFISSPGFIAPAWAGGLHAPQYCRHASMAGMHGQWLPNRALRAAQVRQGHAFAAAGTGTF